MSATKTYAQICNAQRAAYFAWQAAPAGQAEKPLKAYLRATKALEKAQRG